MSLGLAPLAVMAFHRGMAAWAFMWVLAIAIYASLKWASWWRSPMRTRASWGRSLGYLLAWPGMDAESFLDPRRQAVAPGFGEWVWALAKTVLGVALLWGVAREVPERWPLVRGWVGLVGMVLIAHFGSFHVVSLVWRSLGVDAVPIMASPLLSQSLSEFWGRRWNLGFRQLGHELIFAPLHDRLGVGVAGFLVFVVSGLIHDLVISVPACGGYGLPTVYFVLQGAGVAMERSSSGRRIGLRGGVRGWLFMALFTAGPAFWLFHPPFLRNVVLPLMQRLGAI
ncbi:MAG TPA: MBOAT family protein [Terriglobales bacterium]|nr:MBOAT family protein [Terriglobales bacterium]